MSVPDPAKVPISRKGMREALLRVACAASAFVVIASFHAVGREYYDSFRVPQGYGMNSLLPTEVVHYALFALFGLLAAYLLAVALLGTSVPAAARAALRAAGTRPWRVAVAVAAAVTSGCLLISLEFRGDGILTDDEHVYRFIAQTLRTGSLTAPPAGSDAAFFWEQFVVVSDRGRYGKYPIGFPILLAAGQVMGVERAVVPILTGLLALLMAWIGLKELPAPSVVLALVLFALSPQVLLMGGATLFSQTAAAACLMAAVGCLLELMRGARRPGWWGFGAGAFLGYGILTRPLPCVLFAGAAIVLLALGPRVGLRAISRRALWIAFLAPLACGPAALLWVNYRQSGDPLVSGYQTIHQTGDAMGLLFQGTLAMWAMSLVSHVVRLNFWLLGWPISLAFCAFARRTPLTILSLAMVAAEVVYRLLTPKAGVGHAGPLYVYEVVPLLCLLSGDGVVRLADRARRGAAPPQPWTVSPNALAAALLSLTVVNVSLFLPFKLADVSRAAYGQQEVFRDLRKQGVHHAVVFHRTIVPPWLGLSWAYFPPPNSPRMDDDVLFALMPDGPDATAKTVEFWRRRFPDRQAWVFGWDKAHGPWLVPLLAYAPPDSDEAAPVAPAAGS